MEVEPTVSAPSGDPDPSLSQSNGLGEVVSLRFPRPNLSMVSEFHDSLCPTFWRRSILTDFAKQSRSPFPSQSGGSALCALRRNTPATPSVRRSTSPLHPDFEFPVGLSQNDPGYGSPVAAPSRRLVSSFRKRRFSPRCRASPNRRDHPRPDGRRGVSSSHWVDQFAKAGSHQLPSGFRSHSRRVRLLSIQLCHFGEVTVPLP